MAFPLLFLFFLSFTLSDRRETAMSSISLPFRGYNVSRKNSFEDRGRGGGGEGEGGGRGGGGLERGSDGGICEGCGGGGGGVGQTEDKDLLFPDPVSRMDIKIYLKRYPPEGYKDPDPVLYLVKTITST